MLWFFELIKNLQMRLKVENEIGTFLFQSKQQVLQRSVYFL